VLKEKACGLLSTLVRVKSSEGREGLASKIGRPSKENQKADERREGKDLV